MWSHLTDRPAGETGAELTADEQATIHDIIDRTARKMREEWVAVAD